MNGSHGRRPTPLAQLRAEAVSTRRLARFYDLEARATDSTSLAAASALVYIPGRADGSRRKGASSMSGYILCPHGDRDWRCPICCLAELRRSYPRLLRAVQVRDKTGSSGGGWSVFGSREPINVAALALLQDVMAAGGLDVVEKQLTTFRDPERLAALRRLVRQWRSRSALILRDALAPYPLTWDTHGTNDKGEPTVLTRPIPCPVVTDAGNCAGTLDVHRDNDPVSVDFGKAAVIRCNRDEDHEWTLQAGGWLRLGVLLGGVA